MTTRTADHGLHFHAPRAALDILQRRQSPAPACRTDWMARLAAWAERQPRHHRLGRWTLMR
jgi:formate-dependent nitrite reductase cytochrome c552 subunit